MSVLAHSAPEAAIGKTVVVTRGIEALRAAIATRLRRQHAAFRLRTALDGMSDAALRDIGLGRADIGDFASSHVDAHGRFFGSPYLR